MQSKKAIQQTTHSLPKQASFDQNAKENQPQVCVSQQLSALDSKPKSNLEVLSTLSSVPTHNNEGDTFSSSMELTMCKTIPVPKVQMNSKKFWSTHLLSRFLSYQKRTLNRKRLGKIFWFKPKFYYISILGNFFHQKPAVKRGMQNLILIIHRRSRSS